MRRAWLWLIPLSSCVCFQPVDEADASMPDASVTLDAGRDAGVDPGVDAGACMTACCQCDFGPPRACPASTDPCAVVPVVAVDRVASLSAQVNGLVTVRLDGGVSYVLDVTTALGAARRMMIENLRSFARPAALEVDCTTNRIVAVHAPFDPSPVLRLQTTDAGLSVVLATSAAFHEVLRSRACYDELSTRILHAADAGALVLVTDRQPAGTEIIDVRQPF